jgi:hypothetical protein
MIAVIQTSGGVSMLSTLRNILLFTIVLSIAPLFFGGCAPSVQKIEESARTFYIRSGYDPSFQKCVSLLSKESFLIIHADKSVGIISTGYKTIDQNHSFRIDLHFIKISEDSTRAQVTIYTQQHGSDIIVQEEDPYREILKTFRSNLNDL